MFSENEQMAIDKKLEQLRKVKEGLLSSQELASLITRKRVSWFEQNMHAVLEKYEGMSVEEKAYRMICFEEMGINPKHSKMTRAGERKIIIESRNFCPYLIACQELGLDTRYVCREIVEPSIQAVCKMINPNLRFSRNYQNIRPHSDFCEEYIEII